VVAIDVETTGLDPFRSELRLVTVCRPGEEPEVFDTREAPEEVRVALEALQHENLVGHNIAFDLAFIKRYAEENGFEWVHDEDKAIYDTMILSQVIHAGHDYKHGLEACLKRELGIEISKEQQKSDWSGDLTEEQIEYAKNDVRHLGKLREALEEQVTNDLRLTVELERNLLPVLVDMKLRGVRVDVEGWRDALDSIQEKYDRLTCELNDNYGEINWNSPSQILNKFKELGISATKTDEGALKNLAKDHQVARDLLEHRKYKTLVQRYGKKWLEHVHDGRIHPNWKQTSTATGRMSCSEPNLQQTPRDGKFRDFFVPSGGKKFVVADYSQIELRIAAKLAEDEKMLDAFRHRQDLHKLTASMITDTPEAEVTKEQRQLAKALNFGLSFGMGAKRLKDYAKNNYEVELTVAEAEDYRKRWFDAYPNFRQWHRNTEQKAKESGGKLDMCTFRGRVRNGVEGYSERFNFPVQGSGADGMKLALVGAAKAGLCPVLAVHDEIVCEVDASRAQEAKDLLEKIMREAMLEALTHPDYPHVPIEVEPEVKDVWVK